ELIPHSKLRRPSRYCRIHRPSQPRREKRMDRDTEMRSIEEIENFGAKFQLMPIAEAEEFVDSQIGVDNAGSAECVAPDGAVSAGGRQQPELFGWCGWEIISQRAAPHFTNTGRRVQPVGQIAVEVHVNTRIHGEGLSGLQRNDARELPSGE